MRFACIIFAVAVKAHPGCIHEELSRDASQGGVRNLGYRFANASYVARRRLSEQDEFQQVRIHVRFTDMSDVTPEQDTFVRLTMMPKAVDWIRAALRVRPVQGSLRVPRTCLAQFVSLGVCAQASTPECAGGPIPEDLLQE